VFHRRDVDVDMRYGEGFLDVEAEAGGYDVGPRGLDGCSVDGHGQGYQDL